MNKTLPPGFIVDEPETSGLPEGFVMDTPAAPTPPKGFTLDGPPSDALDAAHAEFEEKSLSDVTGARLRKGSRQLGAGIGALATANNLDILGVLDEADALDAEGADLQAYADLAAQHSRLSLRDVQDPTMRAQLRERFTQRAGDAAAVAVRDRNAAQDETGGDNPVTAAMQQELSANGFTGKAWELFKKDPTGVIGQYMTESAPNALATVGGAVFAGGPAGAGVAGYGMERGNAIFEALDDAGVDTSTPDAVLQALNDPDTRATVEDYALKRGLPIAAMDALTIGLGKLATSPVRAAASQVTAEPAAEATGEALAQQFSTGELDAGEIVAEGLGGVGSGAVQAAVEAPGAAIRQRREAARNNPDAQGKPQAAGEVLAGEMDGALNRAELPAGFQLDGPTETVDAPNGSAAPDGYTFAPEQPTDTVEQPTDAPVTQTAPEPVQRDTQAEAPAQPEAQAEAPAQPPAEATDLPQGPTEQDWKAAEKANPEMRRKQPFTHTIKGSRGGFQYYRETPSGGRELTPVGQELQARGITPRSHPYLFNRNGATDVDNIVASEVDPEGLMMRDASGNYLDRQGVLDALTDEATGGKPFFLDRQTREAYDGLTRAEADAARADVDTNLPDTDRAPALEGTAPADADAPVVVPAYDENQAGFDPDYDSRRTQRVAQLVDERAAALGVENTLTVGERRAIITGLSENGGDVEVAIENGLTRSATTEFDGEQRAPAVANTDVVDDIPFGPTDTPGATGGSQAQAGDTGRAGQGDRAGSYATENTPEGGQLLIPGAEARQTGEDQRAQAELDARQKQSKIRRGEQTRVEDDEGGLFAPKQDDLLVDAEAPDAEAPDAETETQTKPKRKRKSGGRSGGSMADAGVPALGDGPTIQEASTTDRMSTYRQAWRDAGMDPVDANNMTPQRKIAVLTKLFADKFGITIVRGTGRARGKANDAVDNLLDAYRNLQAMAHALALPVDALSLGKKLSVSMDGKNRSYLGLFRAGTNTIHMPGRSNSFAHEWAHALDKYLLDVVRPGSEPNLLSRVTRKDGLDPNATLEERFINLVHTLFFDEADMAVQMMRVEREASATKKDGTPTKKALDAQKKLERMASGATKIRVRPSVYRDNSIKRNPKKADYFGSVHELLARAFEAYVAHKMDPVTVRPADDAGVGGEFVTKGNDTYLNDADEAIAALYPQAAERLRIFKAFDEIFDVLTTNGTLTDGKVRPGAMRPQDTDVLDLNNLTKRGLIDDTDPQLTDDLRAELVRVRNGLKNLISKPGNTLRETVSAMALNAGLTKATGESNKAYLKRAGESAADHQRQYTHSLRGFTKAIINRQPPEVRMFLQEMMDRVMTDHGTGAKRTIGETFEEAREAVTNAAGSAITTVLKRHNMVKWSTGQISDADNTAVRNILLGKTVKGATKSQRELADVLRNLMEKSYRRAVNAGIEMGYVENTGYLPRVLKAAAVDANPAKFEQDATKLYGIMFDQIIPQMSPEEIVGLARRVARRIDPVDGAAYGAELNAVKAAQKAVDEAPDQNARLAAQRDLDSALDDLTDAMRDDYASTSAADWRTRVVAGDSMSFDSLGPDADFTKKRTLPPEADTILAEWYDTDVLVSTLSYVHGTEARAQYNSRYGKPGGYDKIDQILRRPEVRASVRKNRGKYNPDTAKGRLNILRDLTDPARDNIKEMALNEAADQGARRGGRVGDPINTVRSAIENITGHNRGSSLRHADRFSAGLYVFTYIALLARASWSSLAEPTLALMRTGDTKTLARTYKNYVKEAVRGAESTKEISQLADAIGLVSTPLHDVVLMNRMSGDHGHVVSGNTLMTRFFRANFLAQLTNAQRRSVMAAGSFWLRDLATEHSRAGKPDAEKQMIEAEFRELGVTDDDAPAFMEWLRGLDGLPSVDQLSTPEGQVYSAAIRRFTDQTIQNPRRADKPVHASGPMGRVVYSLTSFLYSFYANVHAATAKRAVNYREISKNAGENQAMQGLKAAPLVGAVSAGAAAVATGGASVPVMAAAGALGAGTSVAAGGGSLPLATTAAGFAALFAGQFAVSTLREAIYNRETWDEKEDEDAWGEWMGRLALSRTGVFGPGDVLYNALTGLRYERDLTSLVAGSGGTYVLGNVQNIVNGSPMGARNSPNTNTAERTAAKSAYRLTAVPAVNSLLASAPVPGPVANVGRFFGMQVLSSNTAASYFADTVAGTEE